ncbi:MAG: tetratricopeptide repeat protein [Candidatus Omnitrophica bacterium]|nr:tetratricopeptide repeat protein [Candidatus Omnitrophota bacterium]
MKLQIILISFFLLVSGPALGWSSIDKTGMIGQFYKANAAYKANSYEEALKLYQQIYEAGYASAAVYYNMANCFIKQSHVGLGLLWYERALRLWPRDADVLVNHSFAQGLIKNPEPRVQKGLAQRIFVHLPRVSRDEIVMVLVLVFVAMSSMVLTGLYLRWRFKKTVVVLVILGALFVFHVFAFVVKIDSDRDQSIVLETAEVKYEPESGATTHYTAYEGWKVRLLRESEGWVKIERPDGLQGWIPSDKVEKI